MVFFDRIPPATLPRATTANVTPIPSYCPPKNKAVIEVLTQKAEKAKKRQAEAKAHQRNVRKGKKK